MITAVVGGAENAVCAKELCRILEKFGGAFFVSQNCVLDYSAIAPEFLVFNTDVVREISSQYTVLLLGEHTAHMHIGKGCRFDRVIAEGRQEKIPHENIISVGMRQSNLISIASVENGTYSISVQKTIRAFDGREILPCEFSVICQKAFAPQTVLFAFTLLLLSGKADTAKLKLKF